MILLTFVSITELRFAKWEEFELGDKPIWIIPTERMKVGKVHKVPLES